VFHYARADYCFTEEAARHSPSALGMERDVDYDALLAGLLLLKQETPLDNHDCFFLEGDYALTLCKFKAFGQQALKN
jgi:hypothetical protein